MPGNCVFNDMWLKDKAYCQWLCKTNDKSKAKCSVCDSVFDISGMGVSAVNVHMSGKKHISKIKANTCSMGIRSFCVSASVHKDIPEFSSNSKIQETSITGACSDESKPTSSNVVLIQNKLDSSITKEATIKSEIYWALKVCSSHYSYKSCEDVHDLFKLMFPDSDIATSFSCAETKCAYLCSFGLAPYFLSLDVQKVKQEENFVLLFDETTNKFLQEKQLDFYIRFWDKEQNISRTSYLHSDFLGHATADVLKNCIDNFVLQNGFSKQCLLQISMDGPNVNWKVYDLVTSEIKHDTNKSILHTGSCGLHIVHGAFKKGSQSTGWDIGGILSALHTLFKHSPARREDFTTVTTSEIFPLKFCSVRWLENSRVANRALEMWPFVSMYVKAVKERKVTDPKTKTFSTVKDAVDDLLTPVKISVFISVAKLIEPFLELFQDDQPMLPFLSKHLQDVLRSLMERFIKDSVLKDAKSASSLISIDINEEKNRLPVHKVQLGFQGERKVKELLKKGSVKESDCFLLRKECQGFLSETVKANLFKCPLSYSVVRFIACLDPRQMDTDKNVASYFTSLLRIVVDSRRVEEEDCDKLISLYKQFITEFRCKFSTFKPGKERLDKMLFECVESAKPVYDDLWSVFKMLLILSHGQASVERGFSVNRQIEVENMAQRTFVAQRIISQHVNVAGGPTKVKITKQMILSVAGARQKWQAYLDEQRREKFKQKEDLRKRAVIEDIDDVKRKKKRIDTDIQSLTNSADKLAEEAESSGKLSLITKSNSFRRTVKDKKAELLNVDKLLSEKLEELKKI